MKIFRISTRHLSLLDIEFHGRIAQALAEVVRAGHEPEIRTVRLRADPSQPSTWELFVTGDGRERRFSTTDSIVATAIAVSIYAADFAEDLRADLRTRTPDEGVLTSLDKHGSWLHRDGGLS